MRGLVILLLLWAVPGLSQERVPQSPAEISLTFAPLVREAAPAVVNIYASRVVQTRSPFQDDPIFGNFFRDFGQSRPRVQNSLGSGVILSADGIVVSNYHVVGQATEIRVVLNDRREYQAEVLLGDEESDLAILRLEDSRDMPHLELRDSDTVEVGELVLDRTPFYAESGGQAADAGIIEVDGARLEVLDVQRPVRGLVVHQVRVVDGELALGSGSPLHAQVDPEWRIGARQAHSGTHVVHAALREVLGPTALQSGSYNRPGYLRLDFGWTTGLTPGQLKDIEEVSNRALRADLPVSWDYMTLPEAKDWGAIALFGETYDESKVRVVEIGGPWSRELCGGTHVDHSSQIGTVVVTGEASVGSGNRRIEAYTGVEGFAYLARERDVVHQLTGLLKTQPDDLVGRVGDLVERLKAAEKEIERARVAQLLAAAGQVAASATKVGPVNVVAHRADGAGGGDVRTLATDVRGRLPQGEPGVVVVVGVADGKVAVVAAANDLAQERGVSAGDLVRAVAPLLGGKGGGKADVAQGGGTDASRVDEALSLVRTEVGRAVGA